MFFDLNVPVPIPVTLPQQHGQSSKKGKGKQSVPQTYPHRELQQNIAYSAAQITKLESRIDLLSRLGYSIIAFSQTVQSKVDPKSHVNILDPLLNQLRKRDGILYLKRLTIVLDEDSEKGNGLSAGNATLFSPYDILALHPTTQTSLANACLTHTQPSPLTTHIISLPLTAPRLPFRMKHTLVRTAIKNGAVFEINYDGALQGEDSRRNWWAAARELARVTKGKGLIVSGGADSDQYLRAPRDVGNLITLLGIAQNLTHDAAATTPKSLLLRAQTRKTYRAVLSEPILIMPLNLSTAAASASASESTTTTIALHAGDGMPSYGNADIQIAQGAVAPVITSINIDAGYDIAQTIGVKRTRDLLDKSRLALKKEETDGGGTESKKKKKKAKLLESGIA